MTPLLYYNPISAIRLTSGNDGENWKKIYNWINPGVELTDRTGLLKLPIAALPYSGCSIPTPVPVSYSYKDCCNRKAQELMDLSEQLQKPLGIMWSGGIDSTRVMVSFLENYPLSLLKERIKVILSEESVIENPEFYRNYILPNFGFINSEYTPWLFNRELILVTGELNDQLMGSDTMKAYRLFNKDKFNQPFDRTHILSYVNGLIKDEKISALIVNAVVNASVKHGVPIEQNCDWFWWYNFCFKWQGIWFRLMVIASPNQWQYIDSEFPGTYLHHFYSDAEFQLWSINNRPYRSMETWTDYKKVAKLDIFNFDGNQDYFDTKIKKGSLYTVFSQRSMVDAIDLNWKLVPKLENIDWYNSVNDFA